MERTLKNLTKAFIGESMARNRYTFYAKIASKEGYEQISAIFLETAEHEKTHAKRLFEHIQELKEKLSDNEKIIVESEVPTTYDTTIENLKSAINGEHYEHSSMYPEFAKIAKEEGLHQIAIRLSAIAKAEKHHEERYIKLLKELEKGIIFKKSKEKEIYKCNVCGNIVEVLHDGKGTLVCCNQNMILQKENTMDASVEKHIPIIEKNFVKPGDKPLAKFCFTPSYARAYCNLHGLWKSK